GDQTQMVKGLGNAFWFALLPVQCQTLLQQCLCLDKQCSFVAMVAFPPHQVSQAGKCTSDSPPVTRPSRDRQSLVKACSGQRGAPLFQVHYPDLVEASHDPPLIIDLAIDGQPLLIQLHGAGEVARARGQQPGPPQRPGPKWCPRWCSRQYDFQPRAA